MATEASEDKRTRIVDTAAKLVHEQGYNRTSLADIARASGVPLGNLYYYFKTKDAIGAALIEKMAERHAALRETWDGELAPRDRLQAFIQTMSDGRDALARHGCPVGTLCTELHKDGGPLAEQASGLFEEFLNWVEEQFRLLGKAAESRDLAFHLVSALQGAILLGHSFHNPRQMSREAKRLKDWVRSL